jgi:ethanolamine utilization protein EutA
LLSGGVAELVDAPASSGVGDLGVLLAAAAQRRLRATGLPIVPSVERLRATVIGASQFTAQLSGNTIHLAGALSLPIHNVPVVRVDPDAGPIPDSVAAGVAMIDRSDSTDPIALAVRWRGPVTFPRLAQLADGLSAAHRGSQRRDAPLIVVMDEDLGASLGGLLAEADDGATARIVIDGLELSDFDYVDIGEVVRPALAVPVVIKSLIFPSDRRPKIDRARSRNGVT